MLRSSGGGTKDPLGHHVPFKYTAVPKLLNYGQVLSNSVGTGYIIVPDNTRYSKVRRISVGKIVILKRVADPDVRILYSALYCIHVQLYTLPGTLLTCNY
jgi:hypothetical protein